MNLRSLIVRTILILLAVTAATAVLGIFTPGTTFVWRLVGTGAICILLGAVALRFVAMIDRPSTQPAGLVGLASCVLIGFIASAVTMGIVDLIVPSAGESWFLTLLLLVGVATMAVIGVLLYGPARSVAASVTMLAVAALLLGLGLFAIWGPPSLGDVLERFAALFWSTAWFGSIAAFALIGWGTADRPTRSVAMVIRIAGLLAALGGVAIIVGALLDHSILDLPPGALLASSIALPAAMWTLLELCRVPARFAWLPVATVGAAAVAMGSTTIGVWLDNFDDLWWRLGLASTIVSVCGVIATIVVSRVARSIATPTTVTDLADVIDLHCPLCKLRQRVPLRLRNAPAHDTDPPATCTRCGLGLQVLAMVPRCQACEHILLWSTTPNCPECGAPRGGTNNPVG